MFISYTYSDLGKSNTPGNVALCAGAFLFARICTRHSWLPDHMLSLMFGILLYMYTMTFLILEPQSHG